MKKFLLLSLALFATGLSIAQTPEFEKQSQAISEQVRTAMLAKNYAAGEAACLQSIRLFETLPDSLQTQYAYALQGDYYNLACMQSLQGKRKTAVKSFVKACELGYDNYGHVLRDTDLDPIRTDKTFQKYHETMRATSDYLTILRNASGYASQQHLDSLPQWSYCPPNDRDLVRVREYFKLDSVAGAGDELSKIRRILTYIHDKILHDGQHNNPKTRNSISMAEVCRDGSRGLNCRGLAMVLNECYLSMGFKSRFVTCMPKVYINDCHVINAVYSTTLDKWLWVDPTQNAWVMDEQGVMLSIEEVRERLRDGRPLVLNAEANWNNRSPATKEQYLENYMAKNLYYLTCPNLYRFGTEDYREDAVLPKYIALCPVDYLPAASNSKPDYVITDAAWFWQSPYGK